MDSEIEEKYVREIFKLVEINGEIVFNMYGWFDDKENFEKQLDLLNDMNDIKDNDRIETLLRDKNFDYPIDTERWFGKKL